MRTSKEGLRLITQREGKILHVYKDSKGLPTAGVGHLLLPDEKRAMPVGTPITQKQCDDWLTSDLTECEDAINGLGVKLSQNEFDALASLAFNIGVGGFKKSTVARKLKAGDHKGAGAAILLWNKPPEIQGRRRGEYHQFQTPYTNSAASNKPASNDVSKPSVISQNALDQPPTQIADQIINTGDQAAPSPAPTDITMNAPPPMGSVQGSTKVTILGIGVPAALVAFFKMVGQWFEDGKLDVQKAFDTVVQLIQVNFKYILILAALVVVMIMLKKIERIVVFIVSMITHAIPGWNSVSVTASEPTPPKSWAQTLTFGLVK